MSSSPLWGRSLRGAGARLAGKRKVAIAEAVAAGRPYLQNVVCFSTSPPDTDMVKILCASLPCVKHPPVTSLQGWPMRAVKPLMIKTNPPASHNPGVQGGRHDTPFTGYLRCRILYKVELRNL